MRDNEAVALAGGMDRRLKDEESTGPSRCAS